MPPKAAAPDAVTRWTGAPDNCWAFSGPTGKISIALSSPSSVGQVCVQRAPEQLLPLTEQVAKFSAKCAGAVQRLTSKSFDQPLVSDVAVDQSKLLTCADVTQQPVCTHVQFTFEGHAGAQLTRVCRVRVHAA